MVWTYIGICRARRKHCPISAQPFRAVWPSAAEYVHVQNTSMNAFTRLVLNGNIIVPLADVFEKFLEQEKARLLEQAQLDEENESDLVGCEFFLCRKQTMYRGSHDVLTGSISLKFSQTDPVEQETSYAKSDLHNPYRV